MSYISISTDIRVPPPARTDAEDADTATAPPSSTSTNPTSPTFDDDDPIDPEYEMWLEIENREFGASYRKIDRASYTLGLSVGACSCTKVKLRQIHNAEPLRNLSRDAIIVCVFYCTSRMGERPRTVRQISGAIGCDYEEAKAAMDVYLEFSKTESSLQLLDKEWRDKEGEGGEDLRAIIASEQKRENEN